MTKRTAEDHLPGRQASAKIAVTPEMVAEGVRTLERHVNLDDHPPIYSLEEIVEWIFKAMERRRADES